MGDLSIFIKWDLKGKIFSPGTYSVDHRIRVNNNLSFEGSSAPDYGGNKNNLNPEQALAAAISSCHMMTFLALARN